MPKILLFQDLFLTPHQERALIGANIFLQETGQGMATDINGYYIIQDIVPGNYTIMVSYVGYDMFKKQISFI